MLFFVTPDLIRGLERFAGLPADLLGSLDPGSVAGVTSFRSHPCANPAKSLELIQ